VAAMTPAYHKVAIIPIYSAMVKSILAKIQCGISKFEALVSTRILV